MYTVLNVTDDLTHCSQIGHQVNDFNRAHRHGFEAVNVDFNHDAGMTPAGGRRAILEESKLRAAAFGLPVPIYSQHEDAEFRQTGVVSFGPLAHMPEKEVTIVKVVGTTLTLAAVIRPQQVPAP